MTTQDRGRELRRCTRIAASFLVQIKGEDAELTLRRGDLSTTGAYFEVPRPVGVAGSVQLLTLGTTVRNLRINVLARVIRTLKLEDAERGTAYGVAFDFMPESADVVESLEQFCRQILDEQLQAHGEVETNHRATVRAPSTAQTTSARVGSLGLRRVVIETDWSADVGDSIEVSLRAPNRRASLPFLGTVARVETLGPSEFRLEVGSLAPAPSEEVDIDWSDDTIARALSFAVDEPVEELPRQHLAGSLDRIGMAPMLALLEMERMSGRLSIHHEDRTVVFAIAGGKLLDVGGAGNSSVVELVSAVVSWRTGTFEFHVDDSASSIEAAAHGITGLLLEAARLQDEEAR